MDDINQLMGSIFISLTSNIDKEAVKKNSDQSLKVKRTKYVDDDLYMNSLISNIAFHIETTRAMHTIIERLIKDSKYPYFPGINKAMEVAQDYIEQEMDSLKPQYFKVISKTDKHEEKIVILEQLYTSSKVEQDLTYIFLKAFGEISNRELFKFMLDSSSEQTIDLLRKYSSFHALLLLDGFSIQKQPVRV
ncbi:hypothetical protein [Bacillus sp. KH172YL63]|uniref:hypothetical protein n=1 Tax=Bacillus sp. KH172YL63 TaxID=2709784 RepID=UPI0013E469A7|nr:hypothetical protein [Bacillus sp. KH172YL63]BCB05770.1 hypothetical protein KH172YL63_39030 [Bacillus sp. KH172YL63]